MATTVTSTPARAQRDVGFCRQVRKRRFTPVSIAERLSVSTRSPIHEGLWRELQTLFCPREIQSKRTAQSRTKAAKAARTPLHAQRRRPQWPTPATCWIRRNDLQAIEGSP